MPQFTRHGAAVAPRAPERETTAHLLLRAWCIFLLFTAVAASAWNNLLGPVGLFALVAATGLVSIVLWLLPSRAWGADEGTPRLVWRRLPWFPLAYLAWAAASFAWSAWRDATAITWTMLAVTTLQGLFVASLLTWRELVRAVASALKWMLALSLGIELWVAVVVRHPILPDFVTPPPGHIPVELYWVRGNLLHAGRIQGIVGNSNLLAIAALLAIIVFAVRFAARAPRRGILLAWIVLAGFLMVRAASATAYLAAVAAACVLAAALLMRTARRPAQRTRWYLVFAGVAVVGGAGAWFARDALFALLGKSDDATGRGAIWTAVWERAVQRPVAGWGFATPWLPWDPGFAGWISDHRLTVFMAHNMWLDAFLQLGAIGVLLLGLMYLAFVWRSWFFAVDRPRWDLVADRPYSALSLLPTMVAALLLVQGLSESRPLMEWGWMFVVMFAFKLKQSPIVGVGPTEQTLAIERGELWQRTT